MRLPKQSSEVSQEQYVQNMSLSLPINLEGIQLRGDRSGTRSLDGVINAA